MNRSVTSEDRRVARVIAVAALVAAVALAALAMFGSGGAYTVHAVFQNAGQLVKGNQVRVGGAPVGTITDIELDDQTQAVVTMKVDDDFAPLHTGTTATIRSTSLSGIANRYVSLTPGPNNNDRDRRRRPHRHRLDGRAGRPRRALQHARPEDAQGPRERHPRVGHLVRGRRPGGERRHQVLRAVPEQLDST